MTHATAPLMKRSKAMEGSKLFEQAHGSDRGGEEDDTKSNIGKVEHETLPDKGASYLLFRRINGRYAL